MSDSATPQTVSPQAPQSMEFSRQYWSELPCPPPGDLPDPGMEPMSLASSALAGRFFTTMPPGNPLNPEGMCINLLELYFLAKESREALQSVGVQIPALILAHCMTVPDSAAEQKTSKSGSLKTAVILSPHFQWVTDLGQAWRGGSGSTHVAVVRWQLEGEDEGNGAAGTSQAHLTLS